MNNFLDHNSWFDRRWKFSLVDRYPTMRLALNLLYHLPTHNIVETGCMRTLDSVMEGNSTHVFALFVNRCGGDLTTIDLSPENIKTCKEVTKSYKDQIKYIVGDSKEVLLKMHKKIDLLYLDSMDCPVMEDAFQSQLHQRNEIMNADHCLHDRSIVLLDDNAFSNGGKTLLTKKWLGEHGWICLLDMYQSLWVKNPLSIF